MNGDVLRRRRAAAQLLHRPVELEPAAVVKRLLAVQAQDLRAARLAVRARGTGFGSAALDLALTEERSLVVAWLGRRTLHLVHRDDYPWLLSLTAPAGLRRNLRRLEQLGIGSRDADRAVAIIERALDEEGPLGRAELAERVGAHGIPTEGQATPHLLMRAALCGLAVLGPVDGGAQKFALTRAWLGGELRALTEGERGAALEQLARRYIRAHGPAGAADLATWIGLPLRDARAGLRRISDELAEVGHGLFDLAEREPEAEAPARLLPRFDPYLLGWKDRAFAVPAAHLKDVHPGGGMVRAVATVDGAAVGTWRMRRDGERLEIAIDHFSPPSPSLAEALRLEAADVARFMGLEPA